MANISAISIYVADLAAAERFYSEALGFRVKQKMLPELILLEHDGANLVLCRAEKPARFDYPRASGVVPGIATENLKKSIEQLKANKAELLHSEPQEFPAGHFIAFRDPAGNVLELLEFKP